MTEIQERLFRLQDQKYRKFQCSLIPTVAPDTVIGVRMPALRKLAAEFAGEPAAEIVVQIPGDRLGCTFHKLAVGCQVA